jgi:hypothetical protein
LKIYLPYLSDLTDYQITLRLWLKFADLENYSFHANNPAYSGGNQTDSAVKPTHRAILHVSTLLATQTS